MSTDIFIFPKIFCPDVGSDFCTSLIHLSSQYACETQRSYYLHSTEILQLCKGERWQADLCIQGSRKLLQELSCPGIRVLLLPCLPLAICSCPMAQSTGLCHVQCHTSLLSSARGLFAHPAWFIDGGNILKRKEGMKSPMTASMALALFFSGPWGRMWVIPPDRGLERNQTDSPCEQQRLENWHPGGFVPNSK